MVQIPLRRAHRLRAITLASPTKKLRPQPTERAPTAWHTNDEYKNAEASEEASATSVVANASENRILPIPTPRHWLHQSCSYKRVSSVGRFYDGLRATQWRRVFVLHEANIPAGGRISQIELGDFLARGHGPEQQALVQMIGSLTEPAPAEKVARVGARTDGRSLRCE